MVKDGNEVKRMIKLAKFTKFNCTKAYENRNLGNFTNLVNLFLRTLARREFLNCDEFWNTHLR